MTLFEDIFLEIDNTVLTNLAGGTANLANIVAPAFQAVFLVYVVFVAWSYWQNNASIESSAIDLVKRVVVWGLILGFSMNISGYNSTIVPLVLGLGDGLSQAFTGGGATNAVALDTLATQIVDIVNANASAAWEVEGIGEKIGAVIGSTFDNALILITSSLFFVIAAAYIVLVKIFLAILVVLGPIFIAFLLFPATRQYGMNWINQVLNYSLLTLLVNIAGGFFIAYVNTVLGGITGAGGAAGALIFNDVVAMSAIIQIVLATLMFVIILWKLPELASSLAGGMAANGFGQLMNTARMAKQLGGGKGANKSGGGSVQGAKTAEGKGKEGKGK